MKSYYKRHLPHIQPPGASIFVTFRLAGSLPRKVVKELKEEYRILTNLIRTTSKSRSRELEEYLTRKREMMEIYDNHLHASTTGPHFLRDSRIAELVCLSMKHLDGKKYKLLCYCIMSNHVHILFTPLQIYSGEYFTLANIMHSIKSYTASEVNRILGRKGRPFWTHESYDHFCRNEEETEHAIEYILINPVKAGLVNTYDEWPWSYVTTKFLET